ncbi:Thermoresistant gluconokinase [Caballeronia sp. SBC1]|uniref:gluconokinase n=1 Tax=unclassified Caballeronia TaxID=2646786 RepID=UPI0013E13E9D|nr:MULTISPECIES: gluconokinase [unclassified Caballeronia]QIE22526.1 Thermoresistant gluconokinase [Caballeronia sp. SBC2]QIN60590.1 Thermoresistant gluconokinase [Caballeronia sp. SBC1]
MILITMGVSGCGKTTIGELLAKRLGCDFADADSFHSQANKDKMHKGIPLTDEDRWPWLKAIRASIVEKQADGTTHVYACSALKRVYRDILRDGDKDVTFVYLKGSPELLKERIKTRKGHFFDPALLQSQLDTLEPPGPDEAIEVDVALTPEQIVDQVLKEVKER